MHVSEIIKSPILTEKTYSQMEKQIYTFAVDYRTNKSQVKRAIEFIFDVKVKNVNILTVRRKPKKMGRFEGFKAKYKKAIVTLKEGQIALFPEDQAKIQDQKIVDNPTKEAVPQDQKMIEIEKRVASKIASVKTKETKDKVEIKDQESKGPKGEKDGD